MAPSYNSIAVIGAGPSGLAAVRALAQEACFANIRVFERKGRVGGLWAYDERPDEFQVSSLEAERQAQAPEGLSPHAACSVDAIPERPGIGNSSYDHLDTNAGARTMAFTHTPLPFANSASSVRKLGRNNSTRPRRAVLSYLEDLFRPYAHLLCLNTHVEKLEKRPDGKWLLTLRSPGRENGLAGSGKDLWWQEVHDAIIVASGHFSIAKVPAIQGLREASTAFPDVFEHSKSWRSVENYVNKKVLLVGGGVSAADIVEELYDVTEGSLHLSQKNELEFLRNAWELPGIVRKPEISRISHDSERVQIEFADGSVVNGFEKVIFATGYRLSYPFLPFDAVTPHNRLAGFYQHIFKIGDPSLAAIGQVRAAISFRIYEYQAVAVARHLAGRSAGLPDVAAQEKWEADRLAYKGPTELFHEIKPDFAEYYGWLADYAGLPAEDTEAYALPVFEDKWVDSDIEVLLAKNEHWARLKQQHQAGLVPEHRLAKEAQQQ